MEKKKKIDVLDSHEPYLFGIVYKLFEENFSHSEFTYKDISKRQIFYQHFKGFTITRYLWSLYLYKEYSFWD